MTTAAWVLIWIINGSGSSTGSAYFETQRACEAAAQALALPAWGSRIAATCHPTK